MGKNNYVVTAKGRQLDIVGLKAANPNARPVGTKRSKPEATTKPVTQNSVKQRVPRISATIPAPRPIMEITPLLVGTTVEEIPTVDELAERTNLDFSKGVKGKKA